MCMPDQILPAWHLLIRFVPNFNVFSMSTMIFKDRYEEKKCKLKLAYLIRLRRTKEKKGESISNFWELILFLAEGNFAIHKRVVSE